MSTPAQSSFGYWREQVSSELDDYARGAAGGFLFGIPLLYTMELWITGLTISMPHALLLLVLSIFIAAVFVVTIGFRQENPLRARDIAAETVDAVGISLVVTVVSLLLLGRIDLGTPLDIVVGRIAIELLPVSLGVAIANHLLPRQGNREGDKDDRDSGSTINPTVRELVAAAAGALLLSLNMAPTDEIAMLVGELSEFQLVAMMLFSLLVSYMIVFEAEFHNQDARRATEGVLQHPLTETVVAYLIALAVSASVMWLIGAFSDDPSLGTILGMTVVLGFPGALGAAAGRLAV